MQCHQKRKVDRLGGFAVVIAEMNLRLEQRSFAEAEQSRADASRRKRPDPQTQLMGKLNLRNIALGAPCDRAAIQSRTFHSKTMGGVEYRYAKDGATFCAFFLTWGRDQKEQR